MTTKPTHVELERAIASVPGVEEAHVTLLPDSGRSRLRIRLANGEDAPTVSWAISATLRERFGIVLDPGAIRPRLSISDAPVSVPPGENGPAPEATTPSPEPTSAFEAPAPDSPSRWSRETQEPVGAVVEVDEDDRAEGSTVPVDEPIEGKVVVIGDRVMLNEAARAVFSESLEASPSRDPLEGTTGPTLETSVSADPSEATSDRDAVAEDPTEQDQVDTGAVETDRADGDPVEGHPVQGADAPATPDPEPAEPAVGSEPVSVHELTAHRRLWFAGETEQDLAALEHSRDSTRAAIRHLDTRIDVSDVRVTATLTHGGRSVTGEASSVPTRKGILRAVAEATVSALRQLTGDRLVVGVDSVVASVAGEPPMATVLVGVVTDAGEETLLGSSLVRQDPERAVMRATLDALNRRVEPWLEFDLAG